MGVTDSTSNSNSNSAIWDEIEHSESFLVCSKYEEAASLASLVIKRIQHDNVFAHDAVNGIELLDMIESAGMVLVQSLNQLGRASEIVKELKVLFVSVAAIPVQVLLTGACFQMSEGSSLGVREFLEEFLSNWSYVDQRYYLLVGADAAVPEGCDRRYILGVDKYMEVVEVYTVALLGMTLKDLDVAVSWVERAALPGERQQDLLRRLHSLYSLKAANTSQGSNFRENDHEALYSSKEPNVSEGSPKRLTTNYLPNGENDTKQAILKRSRSVDSCFWWFRSINLKFGNVRLAITNGKILLGCLIFLMFYVLRRKKATLNGIVRRRLLSIKKALLDLWQLAFSYQVNPLAAVQPLPAATRGGR